MTDLYLLGTGINGHLQLTIETIQALSICRAAYVLHDDPAVIEAIRSICPETADLDRFYGEASIRDTAYKRIANFLVREAGNGGPVAFVVHGSPMFLVSAMEYTKDQAKGAGLSVRVLPGVSSFDAISAALQEDLGYALQMFDGTTLIRGGLPISPRIPALIFQLATIENPKVVSEEPLPQILKPLLNYLLTFYQKTTECKIVYCSGHVLESDEVIALPLCNLANDSRIELWRRPTLFIAGSNGDATCK